MMLNMLGSLLLLLLPLAWATGPRHIKRTLERRASTPGTEVEGIIEIFKAECAPKPKAMIVSLFEPEMAVWQRYIDFAHNITVPGLSPLFPHVFCTEDYELCQVVTGEGEINAASTITALATSPLFDLSQTYFLLAGIAGCSPYEGTLGSVSFSRFTVSVALQYEIDAREKPSNWSTGYFAYGSDAPGQYPGNFYGTEAFEFNEALRDRAADLASQANNLNDSTSAQQFRALYNWEPANQTPSIIRCDTATSDVYYTGPLLSESFSNATKLFTNGSATYCMSAQEDAGVAEALVRAARFGLVDNSRFVVMRSCSDFDQGPPGMSAAEYFTQSSQGDAFPVAVENLYNAGNPFIQDVLKNWDTLYANNTYAPKNYDGDVFGTDGGSPDFGFGSYREYDYTA